MSLSSSKQPRIRSVKLNNEDSLLLVTLYNKHDKNWQHIWRDNALMPLKKKRITLKTLRGHVSYLTKSKNSKLAPAEGDAYRYEDLPIHSASLNSIPS